MTSALGNTNWVGDARIAAEATGVEVGKHIKAAADAVQMVVDKLNEFADSMDEARRQAEAASWSILFALILSIPTIGLGGLFSAAVARIAQLVTQILSRLPSVLGPALFVVEFGLPAVFWAGISAVVDIGAQLIGQSIAHVPFHIDSTSVIISSIVGGAFGGFVDGSVLRNFRLGDLPPPALGGSDGTVAPPVPQVRPVVEVPLPPPPLSPNASTTTLRPPSTVDTRSRSRWPLVMTLASSRCRL